METWSVIFTIIGSLAGVASLFVVLVIRGFLDRKMSTEMWGYATDQAMFITYRSIIEAISNGESASAMIELWKLEFNPEKMEDKEYEGRYREMYSEMLFNITMAQEKALKASIGGH